MFFLLVKNKYFPEVNEDDEELRMNNTNTDDIKYNFYFIKNLSRLNSGQCSKHTKKFICDRCLNYFHSRCKLDSHSIYCEDEYKCEMFFP